MRICYDLSHLQCLIAKTSLREDDSIRSFLRLIDLQLRLTEPLSDDSIRQVSFNSRKASAEI